MFSMALSSLRSPLLMTGGAPFQDDMDRAVWLTLAKGDFLLTHPGVMVNLLAVCSHFWALCQGRSNKDLHQSH